jgi:isoleucyl-tRNA synthetase
MFSARMPYKPVSNKPDFNQLEQEIITFWKDQQIFRKSIEEQAAEAETFIFYEGPPTANGKPGVHHVLARTFKDLVCRYQTMQGKRVERKAGWDEHGLPVEIEVEKSQGFNNETSKKEQIEALGIAKFNELCAASTQKYIKEWEALTERMAYWVDFKQAYRTSDPSYIERVWSIIKELAAKDLLYKGYKVVPWAADSGTVVSQAEVALGYKEVIDQSAYVKLHVGEASQKALQNKLDLQSATLKFYLLAWTTTPWTLPSNMALAINPEIEYAICQREQEIIILSAKRYQAVLGEEWTKIKTLKGKELVDLHYDCLFEASNALKPVLVGKNQQGEIFVEDAEDSGTGIVHIAPAFGQDDFNTYQANDLKTEIKCAVDERGIFNEQAPSFLQGQSIFNENQKSKNQEFARINNIICKHLQETNLLHKTEKYEHSYPHNWRTGNPLIYYLRPSWYVATSKIKDDLIKANQQIKWHPEHVQAGRFGKWLENNIDWSISRERFWGTPLPIWQNEAGDLQIIGSVAELEEKSGQKPTDLHRPFIDEISWKDEAGNTWRRVPEVLDCWFDSGSMPVASKNSQQQQKEPTDFAPADYICEAVDQTRGWFYTLLVIGVALKGISPYREVLCLGHILDKEGQKMSKSKGNILDPWDLFAKFGADPVRWFMVANCSAGNPMRFDEAGLNEIMRRFILPLWNTYSFYVLYANLDGVDEQSMEAEAAPAELLERQIQPVDLWITARLNETHAQVTAEYEAFAFSKVTDLLEKLVDDLSNIWVRSGRNRFWHTSGQIDWAAYHTLHACLMGISQLAAPLIPMISELIYQNLKLTSSPASIHLVAWPPIDQCTKEEKDLLAEMQIAQEIINIGRNLRQELKIKIRQPLGQILVSSEYKLKYFESIILHELNVKELLMVHDQTETVVLNTEISEALLAEGLARETVHTIQNLRKNSGLQVDERINLYFNFTDASQIQEILESQKAYIQEEVLADAWFNELPANLNHRKNLKLQNHQIEIALEVV